LQIRASGQTRELKGTDYKSAPADANGTGWVYLKARIANPRQRMPAEPAGFI
jgi:hypothetical protein